MFFISGEIAVAVLSLAGTIVGTVGGIVASAQMTRYRLDRLEKKVDNIGGYLLKIPVLEERLSGLNQKINDVKKDKREYENIKMDYCKNPDVACCDS